MKIEGDMLIFASGKTRYANRGIVGMGAESFDVSEGYDGTLWHDEDNSDWFDDPLTPDDLVELADFMIARWTAFRIRAAERTSDGR